MLGRVVFYVCACWGLWWIFMPASVARFYERFHQRTMRVSRPVSTNAIRITGLLWFLLVSVAGLVVHLRK